jgi:hypothetical protein
LTVNLTNPFSTGDEAMPMGSRLSREWTVRQTGRLIGVFFFVAVVEEDELEGLEALVFGLDTDVIDADRIG